MNTVDDPLINLLNHPFDTFETMSEIHLYIRELRDTIRKQQLELAHYRNIQYALRKYTNEQQYRLEYFFESIRCPDLMNDSDMKWAFTITFDPNRFKAIDLTPVEEQKNYIKIYLYKLIKKYEIPFLYGSFEFHKNGRIHFHGMMSIYNKDEVYRYLMRKFSNSPHNKHCILFKPIDNFNKWLEYINKESDDYILYKKPLENNSLNSLDI